MCINVTNTKPEPTGIGWKVFRQGGRFLTGQFDWGTRRPTKRWLHESDYRVANDSTMSPLKYASGWHIFKTLQGALRGSMVWNPIHLVIRRVRYREAFVEGNLANANVVVAKEILIIPGEVT